jgi:polyribonucleotide nucleotidyltransferase
VRAAGQVRPISIRMQPLPAECVHGSALFTRGETQALATVTLGDKGSRQRLETLDGEDSKRFYLQYTFPPNSVGECGRIGAIGRREIGHGNLAERGILPVLPSEEEFPYTIRLESLITESCGSSSMASVCGGSLALFNAGVPLKRAVAGVAMGLLLPDELKRGADASSLDEEAVILTDILGLEDALGTMDFKVCGDAKGITAFQLDIKCEGLSTSLLRKALMQAKSGRLHMLYHMLKAQPKPAEEMAPSVPKMLSLTIPQVPGAPTPTHRAAAAAAAAMDALTRGLAACACLRWGRRRSAR